MEATPRQRVVRSLPIANSSFYTFYTLYTQNITTLHFKDYRQQTTDYGGYSGITESRIYGIMEATPRQRVVRSLPIANSQRPTDLSIHSIPKYYYITTLQKDIYRQTHSYLVKELYKFCIYTYYMQTTILFQNSINLFPN